MGLVLDPFPYLSTACTAGVHEVCPDPKACKCRCGHPDVASSSSDQSGGSGRVGGDDGAPGDVSLASGGQGPIPSGPAPWRPFGNKRGTVPSNTVAPSVGRAYLPTGVMVMANVTTDTEALGLTDEQADWLSGLHELVFFFEANPDLIPTYIGFMAHLFSATGEPEADFLARIARRLGTATKEATDPFFYLVRSFGPHEVRATVRRDAVCERIEVGTRSVTKTIPDPALTADVPMVTITEDEPVYEWHCPDSILRPTPVAT